jgi:hypothetical protein
VVPRKVSDGKAPPVRYKGGMEVEKARGVLAFWRIHYHWNLLHSHLDNLDDEDERQEMAEALAIIWRTDSAEPSWFIQPPGYLVREVEDILGQPVWPKS